MESVTAQSTCTTLSDKERLCLLCLGFRSCHLLVPWVWVGVVVTFGCSGFGDGVGG